ncbi:MAG: radical SAM protein [Oscillospiraceae bacterium]|nr:radical SAM protein [Oscillospiraceae bacterium]
MDDSNLGAYLTNSVENIVKTAIHAVLKNPKESAFMARYAVCSREASLKRAKAAKNGENIPLVLIASITSACNLRCTGCYSRQIHSCSDNAQCDQLTAEEWRRVFTDARELGVSFIILAGGEPMLRADVIEAAGEIPEILFPVITNGTLLNDKYIQLFDKKRNILPVLSIEGHETSTDSRRDAGIYAKLTDTIELFKENGIIFGASVTVTTENIREVTDSGFIDSLSGNGCKIIFYVEFVSMDNYDAHLALGNTERKYLEKKITEIRAARPDTLFISFPGDEAAFGGCLAAGRGFFHINSHGGAEPCPFSPYSDINVKDTSLRNALRSPLFYKLREGNLPADDHTGGCVLMAKKSEVEVIWGASQK